MRLGIFAYGFGIVNRSIQCNLPALRAERGLELDTCVWWRSQPQPTSGESPRSKISVHGIPVCPARRTVGLSPPLPSLLATNGGSLPSRPMPAVRHLRLLPALPPLIPTRTHGVHDLQRMTPVYLLVAAGAGPETPLRLNFSVSCRVFCSRRGR